MCRILQIQRPIRQCRLSFRQPTPGAERDLIQQFISDLAKRLPDRDYALFVEPKLPTGYPDCVVVEYDPMDYAAWSRRRHALSDLEMRVLFLLHPRKGLRVSSLVDKTGLTERKIRNVLRSLISNGDAFCKNEDRYYAVVDGVRGVRSILSVEAKINDFSRVIGQAAVNQAFSNESYILMPRRKLSLRDKESLKVSRIGMFVLSENGFVRRVQRVPSRRKASSYLVLYFNEWIGWNLLTGGDSYGK